MSSNAQPLEKIKFYADGPTGSPVNKYFVYKVYDLDHSCDLAGRFLAAGWRIRAAFHEYPAGNSIKIPAALMEQARGSSYFHLRRQTEAAFQLLTQKP